MALWAVASESKVKLPSLYSAMKVSVRRKARSACEGRSGEIRGDQGRSGGETEGAERLRRGKWVGHAPCYGVLEEA